MIRVIVSACLLGSPVRPDGGDKKSDHPVLRRWLEEGRIISACPEVLGGLPTPRPPAEIVDDGGSRRVVTREGHDVTQAFEDGARAVAAQASAAQIRVAILKEGSPSCGSSFVYDGTFSGTKVAGQGVTAAVTQSLPPQRTLPGIHTLTLSPSPPQADDAAVMRRSFGDPRWLRLRFSFGIAQMTGAVLTAALLVTEGPTGNTLFAAVLTTILTAASILLFRGRRASQ